MNHFITTALPYANGNLHFGHFFEATIADIYAKYKQTPLISGDDQHGAAITIYCQKNQLNIQDHLKNQYNHHLEQYQKFGIKYSYFGQTSHSFHHELVQYFYSQLISKKLIEIKDVQSWFDINSNQFLPDRYIRGKCPHCHHDNVYPGVCEYCGHEILAKDLLFPQSIFENSQIILKTTKHGFLNSENFYENLKLFLDKNIICDAVKAKLLDEHLKSTKDIDITRDGPYHGIPIPSQDGVILLEQFFYVWFDAPIGYLSFIAQYIQEKEPQLTFNQLLEKLSNISVEHIIGKDISYFHTFFWLNLLDILDLNIVKKIHTHGWITLENGEKISKSKGDSIDLKKFQPEEIDAIRLFFFSNYEDGIEDIKLDFKKAYDFYDTVIIRKFFNIYSRISKIVETKLNGKFNHSDIKLNQIDKCFESFSFKKASQEIILLLNQINQEIQEKQPWKENDLIKLQKICDDFLNRFFALSHFLQIICPSIEEKIILIDPSNIKHILLGKNISNH